MKKPLKALETDYIRKRIKLLTKKLDNFTSLERGMFPIKGALQLKIRYLANCATRDDLVIELVRRIYPSVDYKTHNHLVRQIIDQRITV